MANLGFSTGALAKGRVRDGVRAVRRIGLRAIELSALRVIELDALEEAATLEPLDFDYISLHAPTDYSPDQEVTVTARLRALATSRQWKVVIHPDCIVNVNAWKEFGNLLCIENMDKRKAVGRTADELSVWFDTFPDALLCLDIAHAQQVDPSMTEAYRIIRLFGDRICQLHISEVTSSSKHDRMSESAVRAYQDISHLIPDNVPVILESPVTEAEALDELRQAGRVFLKLNRPIVA